MADDTDKETTVIMKVKRTKNMPGREAVGVWGGNLPSNGVS